MMKKDETLILMWKDYEILSFKVDFENADFEVIDKLERFDLAPLGMNEIEEDLNLDLFRFFNTRKISEFRWDYNLILKNTHTKSSFELAFKGHGLSLANHYWFKREGENLKYDDINFFTNKWDDSFARAVIRGDYEALEHCDLNVPDIVTQGWSVKGWIYEDGPKLIKLGIHKDQYEDSLAEVLASKLAQRILSKEEVLNYDLVEFDNKFASKSPSMLNIDEELIPISRVLPDELNKLHVFSGKNKENKALFYKTLKEEYPQYYEFFVKIAVIKSLCFVSDLHFENISLIKNIVTGEVRPAPLYDLAGAFGSSKLGKSLLSKIDRNTYFIIYYCFSTLDPNWDYSWYDPSRPEGFEEVIKETLSKSSFYTPELIEKIIGVYQFQKESLDEIAKK